MKSLAVLAVGMVGYAVFGHGSDPAATDPAPARSPDIGLVEPATLSALDLQPGDCYNAGPLPPDGSSVRISSVEAVPCSQPHTGQVVSKRGYVAASYTEVETRSAQDCEQEFNARLREQVRDDKRYVLGFIHPDALSWQRTPAVACVVATEAATTGSAVN